MKTIIELDSSKIKLFLECPEKYNLAYEQNLRKTWITPRFKKDYSSQGTYVHALFDVFYNFRALNPSKNSFEHYTASIELFKKMKFAVKLGLDADFEKLVRERFLQYTIQNSMGDYAPIVRNGIPATEVKFSVKLYEDDNVIFVLIGRIDLLCTIGEPHQHLKAFIDHKTQERKSTVYEWKPQTLCYALATGFNYGGFNYFGLQKEFKTDETLHRDFFFIPDWKIESWKTYIIENVFWKIAMRRIDQMQFGKQYAWHQNLFACGGPDEKRTCEYAAICNENNPERQAIIKKYHFEPVTPWSPWND